MQRQTAARGIDMVRSAPKYCASSHSSTTTAEDRRQSAPGQAHLVPGCDLIPLSSRRTEPTIEMPCPPASALPR